jgi:isopentenyldiphosphate isomerase
MPRDELLLCFDDAGNRIEALPRNVVHEKPLRIWHGVTAIWVFNRKNEVLCTRRSEHNEGNPGRWQTCVGGHVRGDQIFIDAAIAELWEEIGIPVSKQRLFLIYQKKREESRHIVHAYGLVFDEPVSSLKFIDGEVTSAEWLSFEAYEKRREQQPESWCNWLSPETHKLALEIIAGKGDGL